MSCKGLLLCPLRHRLLSKFEIALDIVLEEWGGRSPIRTEAGIEVLLLLFFLPLWKRWVDWGFQAPV